ncbi:energy transducer TonB [uncultured Massilia sp.]|uniref:energy transducer TonB n=1 Tax=uncultured Massilia sp. TaxID=169973 RepID=UPI0025ED8D00|nr:energy transducer TonB [uncultured Massilia sp.]
MFQAKRSIRPARAAAGLLSACLLSACLLSACQSLGASAHAATDQAAVADFGSCARPHYPDADVKAGHQGTVTLGFLVAADGAVKQSKVDKSSGYASMDEAARTALERCRFKPAREGGKPVEAWTKVQYVWTLQ